MVRLLVGMAASSQETLDLVRENQTHYPSFPLGQKLDQNPAPLFLEAALVVDVVEPCLRFP